VFREFLHSYWHIHPLLFREKRVDDNEEVQSDSSLFETIRNSFRVHRL